MKEIEEILEIPRPIPGWAAHGPAWGPGRFLQRSRDNLRRQIEVATEELNPIIGEVPVVMHPGEGLPHVLLGFEALHQLNHLQIRDIDIWVLCEVVVLLRIANSLWGIPTNRYKSISQLKESNNFKDEDALWGIFTNRWGSMALKEKASYLERGIWRSLCGFSLGWSKQRREDIKYIWDLKGNEEKGRWGERKK